MALRRAVSAAAGAFGRALAAGESSAPALVARGVAAGVVAPAAPLRCTKALARGAQHIRPKTAARGAHERQAGARRGFCAGGAGPGPKKGGAPEKPSGPSLGGAWANFRGKASEGAKGAKDGAKGAKQGAGKSEQPHGFASKGKGKGSRGKKGDPAQVIFEGQAELVPLLGWLGAAGLTGLSLLYLYGWWGDDARQVSFQEFKSRILPSGVVERIEVRNRSQACVYVRASGAGMDVDFGHGLDSRRGGPPPSPAKLSYYFSIGSVDAFERQLEDAQELAGTDPSQYVPVTYVSDEGWTREVVRSLLPTLLTMGVIMYAVSSMRSGLGGMGGRGGRQGGMFGVTKATVTQLDPNSKTRVMYKDVAGCDEAKAEIMEFVEFLKNPARFEELGAKIPRGALLVGPPGTGKTLLAKATAGEAEVPFLSISGSEFMEMFVGVGPSRVRDLFAQARQHERSIIFIDEIDAIGRKRGRGGMASGGNDERENTLNQLLVEMDGFGTDEGVVVLAGTNRADILDPALLRPGRFDRQIAIDRPDVRGREQIFRVHLGKIKLDREVAYYSERLAALTPGFAGADIANVCNEGALVAAREAKEAVGMDDFTAAVDRVIGGLEKKNKVVSKEERRTVAYHEAGHAVAGWFLEHTEPLLKVSIVPRGTAALGFAQYLPNENLLSTREQMNDMICMALGGRIAEQVMLGKISTGAQNDLERVTKMAYSQVAVYGFSERLGLLSFPPNQQELTKPYSDETAKIIDEEVRKLVDDAYERTLKLLEDQKSTVEALAQALLEKEVLQVEDLTAIMGPRPFQTENQTNLKRLMHGGSDYLGGGSDEDGGEGAGASGGDEEPRAGDVALAAAATPVSQR
jgi:AFG3 family protein